MDVKTLLVTELTDISNSNSSMINFVYVQSRLKFQLNKSEAEKNNFKIGQTLTKLAYSTIWVSWKTYYQLFYYLSIDSYSYLFLFEYLQQNWWPHEPYSLTADYQLKYHHRQGSLVLNDLVIAS